MKENIMNQKDKQIIDGKICPYCGKPTDYLDSSMIYNGKSYGMVYICIHCDAWVGVHKGTDKALGRLANHSLREAKKATHAVFDLLWKEKLIRKVDGRGFIKDVSWRKRSYEWLAKQLDIPFEYCHIGYFDLPTCNKVKTICKDALCQIK